MSEPYRLYNLDVFEYLSESPFGLYGAIPMMLAHKAGLTTGVFWWVPLGCRSPLQQGGERQENGHPTERILFATGCQPPL